MQTLHRVPVERFSGAGARYRPVVFVYPQIQERQHRFVDFVPIHGDMVAPAHRDAEFWNLERITARRAEAQAIVTRMGRDRFAGSVRRRGGPVKTTGWMLKAANRARCRRHAP